MSTPTIRVSDAEAASDLRSLLPRVRGQSAFAAGRRVVTRLRHDRDTTSLERRGTKDEAEAQYIELVRGVARTTSRMSRVVIDVAEGGPQDLASSVRAYDLYESLAAKCRAAVRVNRQGAWRDVAVNLHLQHLTPGSKRKTA